MAFLYYLPNRKPLNARDLRTALPHAFEARSFPTAVEVTRGPDGKAGMIAADSARHEQNIAYLPELQTWRQAPGGIWVGLFNDAPPGPDDLVRETPLDGYKTELADGRAWLCPRAYEFSEPENEAWEQPLPFERRLPLVAAIDADGKWTVAGVLPKHRELWDLAADWGALRFNQPDDRQLARFDGAGQLSGAVLALAANYLVGPAECSLLGLLTIEHAREVLDRLIDRPRFEALAKKKNTWLAARSSAAGSPGPAASPAAAVSPSPITNS